MPNPSVRVPFWCENRYDLSSDFHFFTFPSKMHPSVALALLPPAAGFVVGLAVGSLFGSLGWLHD